jgi:hypothetical protein
MSDSESKFLKFQDFDRDGVIDVCDDDLTTPETACKGPCTPDPYAIIQDWKKSDIESPFLNDKICHFQVTKVTPYNSTAEPDLIVRHNESGLLGDEIELALENRFKEFRMEAVNNLLDFCPLGPRLNNIETRKLIMNAIEYKKYNLAARPDSYLKLLYSVPFDILYSIADAPVPDEEDDQEDEGEGWEKVMYKGETLMTDSLRVRKGLHFYSKLLRVSAKIGEGDAYYVDKDGVPTHKFVLDQYGDPAILTSGNISKMINQLKSFLAARGMALPDGGVKGDPFGPIFRDKVTKLQFSFKDKRLRVLRVWTEDCGDKPVIYNKRSGALRKLVGGSQKDDAEVNKMWTNQTNCNYFINLSQLSRLFNARTEQPWRATLEQYTYPEIKITKFPVEESLGSCLSGHLQKEFTEVGEDILDEIFGLGDMVAYLYNDTLCRDRLKKVIEDDEEMNRLAPSDPNSPFGREVARILAKNQRWKKLTADDDVVMRMCVAAFDGVSDKVGGMASNMSKMIPPPKASGSVAIGGLGIPDELFEQGLQSLKLCGLLDLLFDALGCLLGGMSLDQALPIMIKKALEAMGVEQFGQLFVGLPPEKQDEMDATVKRILEKQTKQPQTRVDQDGEEVKSGLINTQLPQLKGAGKKALEQSRKIMGSSYERPWENHEIVAAERTATDPSNLNNYEGVIPPTYQETINNMTGSDRTVLQQLDSHSAGQNNKTAINKVMHAYIEALIEVYSDNLILILDELGKFPGAPLIKDIMALTPLSCPRPPLFNPGIDDFIKSLDLAFCRKVKEIEIPVVNVPLDIKLLFKDTLNAMFEVAKFLAGMILVIVVNQIISKVCDILVRAVCKALETTGDLIAGLPGAVSGAGPTLGEIIRENICGPEVDDDTLDQSIAELLAILGLGPAAFADRDKTVAFANDLSKGVTRQEFADALIGNPSEEFLESADQMIEFVHTDFREALPNKNSIARFASSIGNVLPLDYRDVLQQYSDGLGPSGDNVPANPSMCASPAQMNNFNDLRAELLGGRATEKQINKLLCDADDDTITDLEEITTLLEGGIPTYVKDRMPTLISEPGCDDGLFPFEPPMLTDLTLSFMGSTLEQLEQDYLDDMLGTGFTMFGGGDRNFGFLTMILADTRGNNLRNHHRKADNRNRYVDFAANLANGGEPTRGFWSFIQGSADFSEQEGQYPYFVAEWLKRQFLNAGLPDGDRSDNLKPGFSKIKSAGNDLRDSLSFESTNRYIPQKTYEIDLDDLGYANVFGKQGISTFTAPDFGFNTIFDGINHRPGEDFAEGMADLAVAGGIVAAGTSFGLLGSVGAASAGGAISGATGLDDVEGSTLKIVRMPRKGDPDNPGGIGKGKYDKNGADICLDFKDNAMGTRQGLVHDGGNKWSYGFEVQCFYSDIEYVPGTTTKQLRNRPDDNIRVQIVEKVNYGTDRSYASPLAKRITADQQRLPPFDLPDWLESIPLIGFFIESLVKVMMIPFSAIMSAIRKASIYRSTNKISRHRKYEFIAVDDGLDAFADLPGGNQSQRALSLDSFPQYSRTQLAVNQLPPQIYALADLTNRSATAELQLEYDGIMETFYKDFSKIIGNNTNAWLYGAMFDHLTIDDFEYGIETDGGGWLSYEDAGYDNEQMKLGISYNEYRLSKLTRPRPPRVKYLDPSIFGGTYKNPPLYVEPIRHNGWWGLVQTFFPDDTACKPHGKNLIDFDEIEQMLERIYPSLEEDTRLYSDSECVRQVPFDRILSRHDKMSLYTLVLAGIRIYASTHLIKAIGTFGAIQPKFADNFSSVYAAYIVERMEEDFKDAQPALWENFNVFKDEEFWYGFLEQAVQCYNFMVNAGEIEQPKPGGHLQRAVDDINNLQTNYAFAYRTKDTRTYTDQFGNKRNQKVPGLWEAKFSGDAGFFETLRGFRERKNLEGIKSVEDSAKAIMLQLVNYELTKMGVKLATNMETFGFAPKIFDLDYWLFENKCVNSEIKYRSVKTTEMPIGLPTRRNPDPAGVGLSFPGPYYTPGGQFRVAADNNPDDEYGYAKEYIGYYHVHTDDDGDEVYMAGQVHGDSPHDVLVPVADAILVATIERKVIEREAVTGGDESMREGAGSESEPGFADPVDLEETVVPIGDVPAYSPGSGTGMDSNTPFKIEKYISLNGTMMNPLIAKEEILSQPRDLYISDVYRGTLRTIKNANGVDVGIEGALGVRHGLAFYYMNTMVTRVEVDALDFKCHQFQEMQPSSKLFHCLLQQLKNDPVYKLLTSYILSMKKVTATLAIYNDMGFLASVGEVAVGEGDNHIRLKTTNKPKDADTVRANVNARSDWLSDEFQAVIRKPGSRVFIDQKIEDVQVIPEGRGTKPEMREILQIPDYYDDGFSQEKVMFLPKTSALTGNEGWEHPGDRPNLTPFTLHWDEWDRILLRNTRAKIKKLFRNHYFSRHKGPFPKDDKSMNPSKIKLKNLRARLFPSPGRGFLPWWKAGRLRGNPRNIKGDMCNGPDALGNDYGDGDVGNVDFKGS